jgi:GWxTD domain-containing protein
LRASTDSNRVALWRQFWQNTDPNTATPGNEALARYFGRLRAANAEFREGNQPGWLTDRG